MANFFYISQDKTALLSSSQKHHIERNYISIFRGLSSQGSAHGRNQKFGFGAALKQKVQSHGRKTTSNYFEAGDRFPSAREITYLNCICAVTRKSLLGYY